MFVIRRLKYIFNLYLLGTILVLPTFALAWNGSPFIPGQTLNPDCLPTNQNCDVQDFSATSPIYFATSTGIISISQASAGVNGYLSGVDWTAFNNKQSAITTGTTLQYLRGDLSLATFPTSLSSFTNGPGYITGNQTITLSGDISGSGATAITTTIGSGKVTNAMLAGSIASSKLIGTDITTVGTIATGTWNGTTIAIANGGTGQTTANAALNALLPTQASNSGKVLSTDGSNTSWISAGTGSVTSVATDATLTGGTITTTGTLGLNLSNANNWTAKQTNTLTTEQLRLAYNTSNYASFTVGSAGTLTVGNSGGNSNFQFQRGASNVTPTLAVINTDSTSKATALLAGSAGSGFAFSTDNSGFFVIQGETKSAITGGTAGQGTAYFRVNNTGFVGIGASVNPAYPLDILSTIAAAGGPSVRLNVSGAGNQGYFSVGGTGGDDKVYFGGGGGSNDGYVGSKTNLIFDSGNYVDRMKLNSTGNLEVYNKIVGQGGTVGISISAAGNVGIGTTSPVTNLSVVGGALVSNLVACGGIQTNSAGLMSCSSDATLKDIQGSFTPGLDAIRGIIPQTYSWRSDSSMYDGGVLYHGFIAQNVQQFLPDAVNIGATGKLQVSQLVIQAAMVNAIKELDQNVQLLGSTTAGVVGSSGEKTLLGKFFDRISVWFADVSNGIGDFFANRVHTKTLCVGDQASGETCITKDQLDQMLLHSGSQSAVVSNSGGSISSTISSVSTSTSSSTSQDVINVSASTTSDVVEKSVSTSTSSDTQNTSVQQDTTAPSTTVTSEQNANPDPTPVISSPTVDNSVPTAGN